jgi:serine/threonine protein kinase
MHVIGLTYDQKWPNVIKIHKVWWDYNIAKSTRLCILMDWAGSSLRVILNRGFRYEGPPWFEIMRGIVNGLTQAHINGVAHGDLKPSNGLSG